MLILQFSWFFKFNINYIVCYALVVIAGLTFHSKWVKIYLKSTKQTIMINFLLCNFYVKKWEESLSPHYKDTLSPNKTLRRFLNVFLPGLASVGKTLQVAPWSGKKKNSSTATKPRSLLLVRAEMWTWQKFAI